MRYFSSILFLVLLGTTSPSSAQVGWTIRANLIDHVLERQGTLVLYVNQSHLAFDVLPWADNPDGRSRIIVDRQAGILYLVDSATRAVRRLALDGDAAPPPNMPALPEGLPAEMQEQVEKAMRDSRDILQGRTGATAHAEWVPTSVSATVADVPCDYHEQEHVTRRERETACFATWEAFPPGGMLRQALEELGALPFVSASGARPFLGSATMGFPLIVQSWSITSRADVEAVLRRETTVTGVEAGISDPDAFAIPEDWPVTDL